MLNNHKFLNQILVVCLLLKLLMLNKIKKLKKSIDKRN